MPAAFPMREITLPTHWDFSRWSRRAGDNVSGSGLNTQP